MHKKSFFLFKYVKYFYEYILLYSLKRMYALYLMDQLMGCFTIYAINDVIHYLCK